jgi:hypothetical protein
MKNLGWGDAFIAFGIIGGIFCLMAAFGAAQGLGSLILLAVAIFGGGRLVLKGVHLKAADVEKRRAARAQPLP